jgi:hypothetical protein
MAPWKRAQVVFCTRRSLGLVSLGNGAWALARACSMSASMRAKGLLIPPARQAWYEPKGLLGYRHY